MRPHLIVKLILVLTAWLTLSGNGAFAMTIMPFGDSITKGFHNPVETRGSYRLELEKRFLASSVPYDYVGDYAFGADGLLDTNHQAIAGLKIEQMTHLFGNAVSRLQPDIVLVLAGTNNHWDTPNFDDFVSKYSDLIDMISSNSPDSQIVFSTVPKFGCCNESLSYWTEPWVAERNEVRIPLMNAALNTVASSFDFVSVVDLFSILDPATDLSTDDRLHPNIFGHQKLAQLFFDEIGRLQTPGDANADGFVDGSDFLKWNNNKFMPVDGGPFAGDFDQNGIVDGEDFLIWNRNKFLASERTMVPEPALPCVILLAFWTFVARPCLTAPKAR